MWNYSPTLLMLNINAMLYVDDGEVKSMHVGNSNAVSSSLKARAIKKTNHDIG